jgi:biotin carboxylase
MRLLVTNTQGAQAYSIIRALRPYAKKIVVTMEGKHRWAARSAHAANSRLVDGRYYVPRADLDWASGIIQKENTEREEVYVRRILEICRLEQIDVIFPSYDPLVYVFSKNQQRFQDEGILLPVPPYDALLIPLDKYKTIQAAQKAGFPHPRTYLPESPSDVARITRELGPPWVLKRRFTAGGAGMSFHTDQAQLERKLGLIDDPRSMPMIQEYIPGPGRQEFHLVADRSSEIKSILCPRIVRRSNRLHNDNTGSAESSAHHPFVPLVAKLVKEIRWQGTLTIQTKVDLRDGLPKLVEMNPRLGLHTWFRTELGYNEPLVCLSVAKGEEVPEFRNYPEGNLLLQPLEDSLRFPLQVTDLFLYRLRHLFGIKAVDQSNAPMSLSSLVRAYREDYFSAKKKVFSPYWRYFLQDPLPCLLWWYALAGFSWRSLRTIGR